MKRTKTRKLVALTVVLFFLLVAGLGAPAFAAKKKKVRGLTMYKANCRACHAAGSEHGDYGPASLIQDQWTRFFDKKYESTHAQLVHPELNKPLSEVLPPELFEKLRKFTIDHAADSEQPMTCGK